MKKQFSATKMSQASKEELIANYVKIDTMLKDMGLSAEAIDFVIGYMADLRKNPVIYEAILKIIEEIAQEI